MKKFGIAILSLLALHVAAQPVEKSFLTDPKATPRQHNVDMQHMRLQVRFDGPAGKVFGTVTHIYKGLAQKSDTLFLDGPGITIKTVKQRGKDLKFTTNKEGVTIFFASTLKWDVLDSLTIEYEATPRKGLYFVGWN